MYGKHFSSMYSGSMVGAGAIVFAVMGYVIANARPNDKDEMTVELNSKLLAVILGEPEKDVQKAIQVLCAPDPQSRTKAHQGRRLIKVGTFDYVVVNGIKYREIRNEIERRRQNREAQARFRAKRQGKPLPGEAANAEMVRNGATEDEINRHIDSFHPDL